MSTNSKEKLRQLLAQYDSSQTFKAAGVTDHITSESGFGTVESAESVASVSTESESFESVSTESVSTESEFIEPVSTESESTESEFIEPASTESESADDEPTKVLSKDLLRQRLESISHMEHSLETSGVTDLSVPDTHASEKTVSDVISSEETDVIASEEAVSEAIAPEEMVSDISTDVPSVASIVAPETELSRVEDTVSPRDELVEGMVEGLPEFKSDSEDNDASAIETEDEVGSTDTADVVTDDSAPVIVDESSNESSEQNDNDLPSFDDTAVASESTVKRALVALKRRPCVVVTACGLILVTALISVAALSASPKKTTSSPSSANAKVVKQLAKSSSSSSKKLSIKEQLTATAKTNDRPYKVEVEDLVGGYQLGKITYYPDNEAKRYTDMSLHSPEVAQPTDTSDTAKAINDDLAKELPTINSTIKVKHKDKVTFETYAKDDGFVTILLYNKKPFGYVTTDKDGYKTNHVTTFYVSDVVADQ